MTTTFFARTLAFSFFLIFQWAAASNLSSETRLIIGFEEIPYLKLGGASEATKYINAQLNNQVTLRLLRPMGNSAILIEIPDSKTDKLPTLMKQIMQINNVQYVDEDTPVTLFAPMDFTTPDSE